MIDSLKSFKDENILKVFNTALDKVRTSRSDLEKETGLSFVTVSKIADAFVELAILKQSFTKDTVQIRKSRLLSTKFYFWIGVYTFEKEKFTFSILDLSLRTKFCFSFIPSKEAFIDDSIRDFLRATERFITKNKKNHPCIGTCALVHGIYDEALDKVSQSDIPHFESLRLKELLSACSFNTNPLIRSVYYEFINKVKNELSNGETVYSLFLNKGNILSAYIGNTFPSETTLANTGLLRAYDNKTLNRIAVLPPSPDEFFSTLASLSFTLLHTVPYSKIILCGNLYSDMNAAAIFLGDCISQRCERVGILPPQVSCTDLYSKAILNISREIRNNWLENLLN